MISQMSFGALVQNWVAATKGRNVPTGLSVEDAMSRARNVLGRLEQSGAEAGPVEAQTVDVLYAMCRCLERGTFALETLKVAYDLAASLQWPEDEFCERDQLLARLAYLAWNNCRLGPDCRAMRQWQSRCISSVTNQEIYRNFLAMTFATRSPSLNAQFLAEPPVLLTACSTLAKTCNTQPALAVHEAVLMYEWLTSQLNTSSVSEEIRYFAGDVAYYAAACFRHLGRFRAHDSWLDLAQAHFANTSYAEPLLARVKWCRLVALYDLHRSNEILGEIPSLTATFRRCGMEVDELKSIFLEASALKFVGRRSEALQRFEVVRSASATAADPLLLGMTVLALGELAGQFGEPERALGILQEALPYLQESGSPVGLGGMHSVTAEVLRNEGQLDAAAREYGKATEVYRAAGLSFQEAYMRVLRSDTLLASGRDDEAVEELAAALPVIAREGAMVDSVAALALLKESLRRKRADPRAIARLRESLASMRREI